MGRKGVCKKIVRKGPCLHIASNSQTRHKGACSLRIKDILVLKPLPKVHAINHGGRGEVELRYKKKKGGNLDEGMENVRKITRMNANTAPTPAPLTK